MERTALLESGGQRYSAASAITRGVVPLPIRFGSGTTPALRATPPDLGGESAFPLRVNSPKDHFEKSGTYRSDLRLRR